MGEGRTERRQISAAAAVILMVAVGALMAYADVRLISIGREALTAGETALGIGALVVGVGLIGIPVAVLVSQLRSVYRRRG